jgi:hypothetical protein
VPNIQEATLLEVLQRPELTPAAKELITLRLGGAHAAVNKLATLRRWLGPDHRVRQVYRYHGAMPGRFTSVGVQAQNLKKPTVVDVAAAIEDVRSGDLARMQERYPQPLSVVGDITRGPIVPAPGHRLFIADLSGIESRGLAWLTNEHTKLEAWRTFDRTGDPKDEPYYTFGAEELKLDGGKARGTGKTCDLAFGYQGSLGAWRRLAPADDQTTDEEVYRRRRAWVHRHPNIAKFWPTSVRQAVNAIENPGELFTVARIAFIREGQFLHTELPSGRRIRYPYARLYAGDRDDRTFTFRDASGGRWEWYHLLKHRGAFGGLIAENATQALCRDIFCEAMLRLEAAGYHIVAHLHDEFVCEVPEGFGNLEEFRGIITTPPDWAPDFPIATKARIADRFIEIKEPKVSATVEPDPKCAQARTLPADDDELEIDSTAEARPITQQEIDVINAGLMLEGIEPLHFASESPSAASIPPPEFDGPPELEDPPARQGNGFDHDGYTSGEQPRGTPATHYVYKDARGRLYMRVTRTSAKSFPTQHWKDGHWAKGWPATVIPYRLPQLLAAPASEPVWICEGEKDADNVAERLGLIATTNPGGASKWQPELAQWFKGKELVYILEDNDDAGRTHTSKVQAALSGIVPAIAVVSFPELAEKADVSDWLEEGGNKQLLLARAERALRRGAPQEIIEPINLWGQFDPPQLPAGLLPDVIERFAREEAELMGVDPGGLAMAALAVCAAALPDHTQLQVKRHDPNWLEAARLWVGLIGNPSTKKTPIILCAAKPLKRLDAELWRGYVIATEYYDQLSKEERKNVERPRQRRLRLEDTTIEAAQEVLKDSPDGVLCIQDELSGWFGAMDKYAGRGAAKDRGFWLQSFHGGTYALNRIARGAAMIENLSVSLLGGIQPDAIRKIADDTVDDGLLQRLIPIVLSRGRAGKDAPTAQAARRYDELIVQLHERKHPGAPLQFDDAALEIRQGLEHKHLELMAYEIINRKLAAHIGKYDGLFARLCLLWHCIEGAEGLTVTAHTARRVADFMRRFLLPHAVAFYAGMLELSDNHDRLTNVAG